MKIVICWIGIGEYNCYFNDFYKSFNDKFCIECDRTFFIFTDNKNITSCLDNVITYEISNSCKHVGFILFRKFKYLMMAEDKYLNYDYVIFMNGNAICKENIKLEDIIKNEYDISVIPHPFPQKLNGIQNKGSCSEYNTNNWLYLQAGIFAAKSQIFLKMANQIESWRMQDKANNKSNCIAVHDESYYQAFLAKNKDNLKINILPYLEYNYPMDCNAKFNRYNSAKIILRDKSVTNKIKGSYSKFKNDLY